MMALATLGLERKVLGTLIEGGEGVDHTTGEMPRPSTRPWMRPQAASVNKQRKGRENGRSAGVDAHAAEFDVQRRTRVADAIHDAPQQSGAEGRGARPCTLLMGGLSATSLSLEAVHLAWSLVRSLLRCGFLVSGAFFPPPLTVCGEKKRETAISLFYDTPLKQMAVIFPPAV